jgi:hypothetical protein
MSDSTGKAILQKFPENTVNRYVFPNEGRGIANFFRTVSILAGNSEDAVRGSDTERLV